LLAAVCGFCTWGGIYADETIEAGGLTFTFAPPEEGIGLVSIGAQPNLLGQRSGLGEEQTPADH
jgi:hypothetical protein